MGDINENIKTSIIVRNNNKYGLMDLETGEKVPWDGVVEISDDESGNELFSSTTAILHVSDGIETSLMKRL